MVRRLRLYPSYEITRLLWVRTNVHAPWALDEYKLATPDCDMHRDLV